jgi:hypothetical protein
MRRRKLGNYGCVLGGCVLLMACASSVAENLDPADAGAGDALLTRRCESVIIENEQDLIDARLCRQIDGDLVFRAPDLEAVSGDALPDLRRVTGSLISAGSRPLREIVLPALREVGTNRDDLLEIGFDARALERIELPELRRVNGSLGIVALGGLHTLDLSSLEVVGGEFGIVNLPQLVDLRMPDQIRTEAGVSYEYLCVLPAIDLPDAPSSTGEEPRIRDVGCCTYSATQCESSLCVCP